MNVLDKMKGWAVIQEAAYREGIDPYLYRKEIQAAIDAAWANPDGRMLQARLFPKGKPSPEEFIITVSSYMKQA